MTTAAEDMMRHGTMQTSVYSDGRMVDHILRAGLDRLEEWHRGELTSARRAVS